MKKFFTILALSTGVLSFLSCAVHGGSMNDSAALSQANFEYAQSSLSGDASTLKVLGIGGLAKSALVEEAKQDMLKNYPLKENQALANVTVNWKTGFYFIVQTNKCTVTADVVEFK
jgi:hypothetical protein